MSITFKFECGNLLLSEAQVIQRAMKLHKGFARNQPKFSVQSCIFLSLEIRWFSILTITSKGNGCVPFQMT